MLNVDRLSLLELDIDTRLLELWEELQMMDLEPEIIEAVAMYMRAAYGQGYANGMTEKPRGRLYRDHGYTVPA